MILRRLSQSCGKLQRPPELGGSDADDAAEHLCKMACAAVAHFEANIDKAARRFANQLLRARGRHAARELADRLERRLEQLADRQTDDLEEDL